MNTRFEKSNSVLFSRNVEQSLKYYNVDAYYERLKVKGAKIISPPKSMEWNIREMLVEDPDGHTIRFGHRIDCD